MRIAVVGAGLAGLSAADALVPLGHDVVVLEARERVGGRVHTRELDNGAVVELGAEFILPGCESVLALAERFWLRLWDKGMRYGVREPCGIALPPGAMERAVAAVEAELVATGDRAELESVSTFLARIDIDPGAREAILARTEVSAAASADDVPAAELALLASTSDRPAPSVAGGNQRLATALAESLGPAVRLGVPVRGVEVVADGVRVHGRWGEVTADRCVVAVPANLVGEIRFSPALPDGAVDALRSVVVGHAAKLFLPLRVPAPPSASLAVPDRYWAWTATGANDVPQSVVSAFAGSAGALERLEVEAGPRVWADLLVDLRPDLDPDPEGAVLSTWDDDPWADGAYSVSVGEDVDEVLGEGIGPIHFAGEYLGGGMRALMEGAIRSGVAAAERVASPA